MAPDKKPFAGNSPAGPVDPSSLLESTCNGKEMLPSFDQYGDSVDNTCGSGTVTPYSDFATLAEKSSLYAPNKDKHEPWIDVFLYTHKTRGGGPVDYIGVYMGADGMVEPEASVKEDGSLLGIRSLVPVTRHDIEDVYET